MILDLRRIFSEVGASEEFQAMVDFSDYEVNGAAPVAAPIAVVGCIKNSAGVVSLSYSAELTYSAPCDRCAELTTRALPMRFSHVVVTDATEDGDGEYVSAPDMQLDFDELARADILLNLPVKFLCAEDCKGVCSGCGRNLNRESCVCKKEIDPRLAALQQLLDD